MPVHGPGGIAETVRSKRRATVRVAVSLYTSVKSVVGSSEMDRLTGSVAMQDPFDCEVDTHNFPHL